MLGEETSYCKCFDNEPEAAVIPMEILRDVAAEHGIAMADLNRFVTVHEIGHQFELVHNYDPPRDVMTTHQSNADEALIPTWPIQFSNVDLRKIREEVPKKDPYHP